MTVGCWETLNTTYLESRAFNATMPESGRGEFLEWVKYRAHLTRGVATGTMVRDEALWFSRIGTFLERADNTTRCSKRAGATQGGAGRGGAGPSIGVGGAAARDVRVRNYRRVTREAVTPKRVTELLLMRDDLPQSVHRCCKELYGNLKAVANEQSAETLRRAGELHAILHFGRFEELLRAGLPRFFDRFQAGCAISARASRDFLGTRRRRQHATAHSSSNALSLRETVKYSAQACVSRLAAKAPTRAELEHAAPGRRIEQVDAHGNVTHLLTLEDPHQEIEIVVRGDVETAEGTRAARGPFRPSRILHPRTDLPDEAIKAFASAALARIAPRAGSRARRGRARARAL